MSERNETMVVSWWDIVAAFPVGQGDELEPDGEPYFDEYSNLVVSFIVRNEG